VVEKDVITLLPSTDKVMRHSPELGDVVLEPVELAIVPYGWDFDEAAYQDPDRAGLMMSVLRQAKARSQEDMKRLLGPTEGQVVGRIEWEKDLEAL
jgi:hypothetical protein